MSIGNIKGPKVDLHLFSNILELDSSLSSLLTGFLVQLFTSHYSDDNFKGLVWTISTARGKDVGETENNNIINLTKRGRNGKKKNQHK